MEPLTQGSPLAWRKQACESPAGPLISAVSTTSTITTAEQAVDDSSGMYFSF